MRIRTIIPVRGRKPDVMLIVAKSALNDKNHNPRKGTETIPTINKIIASKIRTIIPARGRKLQGYRFDLKGEEAWIRTIIPARGRKPRLLHKIQTDSMHYDKNHNPRKGTETNIGHVVSCDFFCEIRTIIPARGRKQILRLCKCRMLS